LASITSSRGTRIGRVLFLDNLLGRQWFGILRPLFGILRRLFGGTRSVLGVGDRIDAWTLPRPGVR
jgi:hypothetical protein